VCDGFDDQVCVGNGRQVDEAGSVGELGECGMRKLERQTRLADSRRTGQCEQTDVGTQESRPSHRQLLLAADDWLGLKGKLVEDLGRGPAQSLDADRHAAPMLARVCSDPLRVKACLDGPSVRQETRAFGVAEIDHRGAC
jgi:hypothetical protein